MTDGPDRVRVPATASVWVALAALSLAACTANDSASLAAPTTSPSVSESTSPPTEPALPRATEPPAPKIKACFALTYNDAISPTTDAEPVTCDGNHTSMTFAVGRIDNVVGGHLLAVDSTRVQQSVARDCPERLEKFLDASPDALALSMLRPVWFTPTVEESDAGADWVRCDVLALAGSQRLAQLGKGRLANVLGSEEGRARYAMCGTSAPDAKDFERVLCRRPHRWRAVGVVRFDSGSYPGAAAVRQRGQAPCEDAGRAAAKDPLDFQWGYESPTRKQWRAGQRFGRCWAPD